MERGWEDRGMKAGREDGKRMGRWSEEGRMGGWEDGGRKEEGKEDEGRKGE